MRTILATTVSAAVKDICIRSNIELPRDSLDALITARSRERSPLAKSILEQCIDNAAIAKRDGIPICQDTGLAVFFVRLGDQVKIDGGSIYEAINDGVSKGYREGYLRTSVLTDPLFDRKNTGDNTPAIIHIEIVKGDKLEITIAPKGGGAENMSALAMLPPSAGKEGVIGFIIDTVLKGGGNPCPPTVVGAGIGGNFERCAYLAKRALMRPLGSHNADSRYAELERDILSQINRSGLGPQGFGGDATSFAVHIEFEPCHLASLPVAVNINCHVHRHKTIEL